jgi:hypothetical protein
MQCVNHITFSKDCVTIINPAVAIFVMQFCNAIKN